MINTIMRGSPGRPGRRKALLVPPRGRWVLEDRLCPRIWESRNLPSRQKEGKAEKTRATQHSGGAEPVSRGPCWCFVWSQQASHGIWEDQGGHFAKSPGNLNRVQNGQSRTVHRMTHIRIKWESWKHRFRSLTPSSTLALFFTISLFLYYTTLPSLPCS